MENLIKRLAKMNSVLFIALCVIFNFLIPNVLGKFINVGKIDYGPIDMLRNEYSMTVVYILIVVLIPIIETYIFQKSIIDFMLKKTNNVLYAIIVSALIFTAFHYYSLIYMILVLPMGVVFALSYLVFREKKRIDPVLGVFIIHMINNLASVLVAK